MREGMRPTLARLFALLALLGLATWLSLMGGIIANRLGAVDLPEGDLAWAWIFAGWYGLIAAVLFGTLALATSRFAGPVPIMARRIGLVLLGPVAVIIGLSVIWQALALVPTLRVATLILVLLGAAAIYVLWRRQRERAGNDR